VDAVQCRKCGTSKTHNDFHKSSRNSSGRQSQCKGCSCAARRKVYHQNPAGSAAYSKAYRSEHLGRLRESAHDYHVDNPISERLRRGRNRAVRAGLPAHHITPGELLTDWRRRGIDPGRCVYTGQPLEAGWHLDHTYPLSREGSPGHVITNLVPCNRRANLSKGRRHLVTYLADLAEARHV
jgi:hypothetical protein